MDLHAKYMSICTRCPHRLTDTNGDLLPEHKGKDWDALPCSTCTLVHGESTHTDADKSNHFQTRISLDALQHDANDFDFERSYTGWGEQAPVFEGIELSANEMAESLSEFLHGWLRLKPPARASVANWLCGQPLRVVAEELDISPQAVWSQVRSASKKIPVLGQVREALRGKRTADKQ